MLLHPQFDPVALSIGPLSIRWYGLMYLAAFVQFIWLGRMRIKAHPGFITAEQLDDLLFYGMLGVIIGGRLGQVLFYEPAYFAAHPLEIFAVWKGGMSFHGGFIGVLVGALLWARKCQFAWLDVTDFIAPLVPLGLAAGRVGNFINGELWGRITSPDLPWAMIFPQSGRPRTTPPVAALPCRAGRYRPICDSLALYPTEKTTRRCLRRISDWLRHIPFHH
jgi:phosphatidylglycerol:prolipoprotein diacylglycerol transferase